MRIGIDARILAHPKCGISSYVYNLVKNYLTLRPSYDIFLFSDNQFYPDNEPLFVSPHLHKVIFASSKKEKKKWAQKFLPHKLKEYNIDIYHATWNEAVPAKRRCPCVLTIHDLAPWILGGHFKNKRKELRYKLRHFLSAHRADIIITVSYKSREDISRICWVNKNKIKVVYLGVDEDFKQKVDENIQDSILERYNLKDKHYFIDTLGIDHPRRNSRFVLEGFYEFLKKNNKDYYLVYTGNFYKESKEYVNLIKRISELNLKERVVITGWIPTQDLIVLLSNAVISIIPSLYEGFCLPLLESFACGVPVIASNRGSIPEVAGGSAVLLEPYDVRGLVESMSRIVRDEICRSDLVGRARKRVADFSWKETAEETLSVYESLMGKKY